VNVIPQFTRALNIYVFKIGARPVSGIFEANFNLFLKKKWNLKTQLTTLKYELKGIYRLD